MASVLAGEQQREPLVQKPIPSTNLRKVALQPETLAREKQSPCRRPGTSDVTAERKANCAKKIDFSGVLCARDMGNLKPATQNPTSISEPLEQVLQPWSGHAELVQGSGELHASSRGEKQKESCCMPAHPTNTRKVTTHTHAEMHQQRAPGSHS